MVKIKSFEELQKLKTEFEELIRLKKFSHEEELKAEGKRCHRYISICGGTGCKSSASYDILKNFNEGIEKLAFLKKFKYQ